MDFNPQRLLTLSAGVGEAAKTIASVAETLNWYSQTGLQEGLNLSPNEAYKRFSAQYGAKLLTMAADAQESSVGIATLADRLTAIDEQFGADDSK